MVRAPTVAGRAGAGPCLAALVAGAALLVSCSSAPEPVPLRGPAPRRIAVMPIQAVGLPPDVVAALDESAHLAIEARGYEAVPAVVTANMLHAVGAALDEEPPRAVLDELQRRFELDALMWRGARLETSTRGADDYVVEWHLVAADPRGTGVLTLWAQRVAGGPGRIVDWRITGPQSAYETNPFLSDENLIARELGGVRTDIEAVTPREQADDVHGRLAALLPDAP
ncbi:MAG: hypothetical protein IPM29_04715 [Planctomycetes bacterium]|nr:hypothetical protein [Planctomycetota bacterium]